MIAIFYSNPVSISGVKPIDKRDGAGSRNWGTYKDELE